MLPFSKFLGKITRSATMPKILQVEALPDIELCLVEEDFEPFSAEVVEGRLGQQLFGVQLHEVFGLADGGWHQRLQDGVNHVQHLQKWKDRISPYSIKIQLLLKK